MTTRVTARLESFDPGFARSRAGAGTACASALSGLTIAVVGTAVGVADPLRTGYGRVGSYPSRVVPTKRPAE